MWQRVKQYVGPQDDSKEPLFPKRVFWLVTMSPLVITYLDQNGEAAQIFLLEPGRHYVKPMVGHHVLVDCDEDCNWHVEWPNIFTVVDPTRVSAAVMRPRSQNEEMQDYFNMLVAKAANVGFIETKDEDWNDPNDMEYDLSIPQMDYMLKEMAVEMEKQKAKLPKDDPLPKGATGGPPPV